jgi:hypothetical protein
MPYTVPATSDTPALIVYLLDSSGSMQQRLGAGTRQEVVTHALQQSLQQMVFRSTKGMRVSPRYRVAIFAYNEKVYDLLDGVRTIDDVLTRRIDGIQPSGRTNTAQAFERAEALLLAEIPTLLDAPAPLVCHMTDGEYNDGPDPFAAVSRVKNLEVPDGHVLVENVFMSDQVLTTPIDAVDTWPGVSMATPLRTDYARRMRDFSSALPQSYRDVLVSEHEYVLAADSVMMFPGTSPELIELAFQVSASTPLRRPEWAE